MAENMKMDTLAEGDGKKADEANGGGGGVRMEARMSLLNGITVIIGSIIGSGIFIAPTGVLEKTGSVNLALIIWTISGLFALTLESDVSALSLFVSTP